MKIYVAWHALRRSSVQDAVLAALLLAGTWVWTGTAATEESTGWFGEVRWLQEPVARWALIGVCVAAVAVRRTWPIPALAAASLATVVQMSLAAGPVPADLAVPVALYTIAAQRRRQVSLALLGAALAVATAWSAYVTLDGKADGWLHGGPRTGGQERPPGVAGPPPQSATGDAALPRGEEPTAFGPTDWGGIPVLGSLLLGAWAIGWGLQSRRAYLGELRARARDLERERDQQAALAVAAERARITRELHDVVAHGLAVIVMQAQGGAAAFANRPDDTLAALDTIVATGRASLADMRHVLSSSGSGQIDGDTRPVPGLAQLPRLIGQVRQAGTPVQFHLDGSPRPLPAGVDVSSYRIVQEALTNTMKHAGPGACVQVVVSYTSDELSLEVSDNGTGGPAADKADTVGNGLRGMRERAALLGGEVAAGPEPGGGYAVRARIPVDPPEPGASA
ncbi:sensor histidine kinase [Streptomyces sp. NPDC051940]|uniref:sensor histidine kinase n=1 Tax=Streptomyces sp. NPDC051940 TaxID=3155675 RepID=UPI00343BCD22